MLYINSVSLFSITYSSNDCLRYVSKSGEENEMEKCRRREKQKRRYQRNDNLSSISLQNSRNKLHLLRNFTTIFYSSAATSTKGNFIHIIKKSVLVPI